MPASEAPSERRGGQLFTILFWVGVGLAPLAVLMLLIGQSGGALRVAVALTLVAVVLIGLSITLRRDSESLRLEMEETLLEEVEVLREDVRNDIATAARATHKAFSEKLNVLNESVQALRGQVQAGHGGGRLVADPPRPPQPPRVERPEPPAAPGHVAAPGHMGAPGHMAAPGQLGAPGHRAAPGHMAMGAHVGMGSAPVAPAGARARVPGGVVRHTETVQVTTRQTIVDPHGDEDPNRGRVYGGSAYGGYEGYGGADGGYDAAGYPAGADAGGDREVWSEPSGGRRRRAEPDEEWSDQRYRGGGDGRRPRPYDRLDDPGGPGDPGADPRWTDVKAGDRWAAVRSDDRGRELRMGERRAEVHTSDAGHEVRIEDRWAAVRRAEPGPRGAADPADGRDDGGWLQDLRGQDPRGPDPRAHDLRGSDARARSDSRSGQGWSDSSRPDNSRADNSRPDGGWSEGGRSHEDPSDDGWERRSGPAALPAGGIEPTTSWGRDWSAPAPARDTAGRRRRYRDDEDDGYGYQPPPDSGSRRSWR